MEQCWKDFSPKKVQKKQHDLSYSENKINPVLSNYLNIFRLYWMSFCRLETNKGTKAFFACPPAGVYVCSKCNHPLFSSRSKFAHSSPWPAFTETIREDSVTKMMETLTAYKVRVTTKQSVHCSNKNHNYSHLLVPTGGLCTLVLCVHRSCAASVAMD